MSDSETLLYGSDGKLRIVDEGETPTIKFLMTDDDTLANLSTAAIQSLTLKLINASDRSVINARNEVDVLNTAGGTVSDNGDGDALVVFKMTALDNVNVGTAVGKLEKHLARFTWGWTDQAAVQRVGKQVFVLYVAPFEVPV